MGVKRLSAIAVAVAWLLAAASAGASVGIGATPGTNNGLIGCGLGSLYVQPSDGGAPGYSIPANGVITSWSTAGPTTSGTKMGLKVVRTVSPTVFKVTGTAANESIAPNTLNQFRARVPVGAGDRIAIWVATDSGLASCGFSGVAGDQVRYGATAPEPAVGADWTTNSMAPSIRLNLSAQLEPDADGDGYGDETQDDCPAEPLAHDLPCDRTPPETTITKLPKKVKAKGRTADVSIAFSSSEGGASLTCTLDGKSSPCTSPFKAKVKKGAHKFGVVATDAAGNADATPAEGSFSLIKKKPKHAG